MDTTAPPHNYHTRIQNNIIIKPAARLRHQDDAPAVNDDHYPPFPPPHIVLHPDDATNKVFLAVARAFVSVDNRAMTIKDIADRASRYGLVCQNLSAAAQAVTTYLRSHKARCDKQQDQPLLLSHTLSGTPADDDLVPALFSRSGGDSHPLPDRLTNFRKGTAVWYLSRATGIPCPFTRAGIRLCDYVSADNVLEPTERLSKRERRRMERDQICGQKRKRPLRGCVGRASGSDNERPPKVKLTLRLKPLVRVADEGQSAVRPIDVSKEDENDNSDSSDSDDSMSVDSSDDQTHTAQINNVQNPEEPWSLPPYPRRSISIPCYTPSVETCYPSYPSPQTQTPYKDPFRRSPSAPFATPPPDSEDEMDDFHVTMARTDFHEDLDDADMGWDADIDSEGEGDTVWESPGPRSPSAPLVLEASVAVKEEPRDVQGMLDAWEDFDSTVADARVAEVLTKALEGEARAKVKLEPLDPWDWDAHRPEWQSEDTARIKQEDLSVDSLFPQNNPGPSSPLSDLSSQFAAFSYSDAASSSPPQGTESPDGLSQNRDYAKIRPRAKTVPAPSPSLHTLTAPASFSLPPPPVSTLNSSILNSSTTNSTFTSRELSAPASVPSTALGRLLQSVNTTPSTSTSTSTTALAPPTACVSPLQTRCQPSASTLAPVVVTTCQPCKPSISATQIEDISVYQMMLGAFQLLRRIDTDFVNLSPILAFSGAHPPTGAIANATVVTKGSPEVSGIWVPLAAAQAYVKENLSGEKAQALEVFLSDTLVERFPTALQDFHRTTMARGLNQFGRHFASTLQAAKWEVHGEAASTSASAGVSTVQVQPHVQPFVLGLGIGLGQVADNDVPLSATEQELFHELCVVPDEVSDQQHPPPDVEMDMDPVPVVSSPPPRRLRLAVDVDLRQQEILQEPMSPLSPLPPSPLPTATLMTPLMLSPELLVLEPRSLETTALPPQQEPQSGQEPAQGSTGRPLRRSKRVADAVAASHPTPSRARPRKNGSRNSLS